MHLQGVVMLSVQKVWQNFSILLPCPGKIIRKNYMIAICSPIDNARIIYE